MAAGASWPQGRCVSTSRCPPCLSLQCIFLTGVPKGLFLKVPSDPIFPPLRSFLCKWIRQKDQVGQMKGIPS